MFDLFTVLNGDNAKRACSAELWGRNLTLVNSTCKTYGEGLCKFFLQLRGVSQQGVG